jgi:hypothetical protein
MTDETKARFFAGIAAQVPAERVAEVHLFGAIRQGGQESGVAVIALDRVAALTPDTATADAADVTENDAVTETGDVTEAADVAIDTMPTRYTVYTARFRHTLKGPERGKWELAVIEEADAPLLTVDAVVRGVSRRSGEADETIRLSGDEFRAALPEPARR